MSCSWHAPSPTLATRRPRRQRAPARLLLTLITRELHQTPSPSTSSTAVDSARNNGWWLLLQIYYRLRKLKNTENWLAVGEVTGERVVHCVFIHGVLHVGVLLQCIVLFLGKWIDYKTYLFTCLIIYYLETAKYQKNVTLNPIWLGTKVCCTFLWMKINLPCGRR